ncbi:hypothetical protein BC828DRAFT_98151 [Blastocladiella britannica]|nr:hypothetical protein BC828DRAFT_98151 [Blastocladiella britannica]
MTRDKELPSLVACLPCPSPQPACHIYKRSNYIIIYLIDDMRQRVPHSCRMSPMPKSSTSLSQTPHRLVARYHSTGLPNHLRSGSLNGKNHDRQESKRRDRAANRNFCFLCNGHRVCCLGSWGEGVEMLVDKIRAGWLNVDGYLSRKKLGGA